MSFIEWGLTIIAVFALAFMIYYQVIIRALHIDLKAREIHSILTPDGWRIRLFRYRKGGSSGEPVLLVHGYTANHWNLTLPQGESLADFLVEKGYDCWAIDLRGNRTSLPPHGTPRHRATYDGYVMQDLPAAISFIQKSTGYDQVHWVGHSMGGMLLYAYELAHGRESIASGTTLASPPWLDTPWTKSDDRMMQFLEMAPRLFEILKRAPVPIFSWLKPSYSRVPIRWDNLNPRFRAAEFFNAIGQSPVPVTRTFQDCAKHRYLAVDNDRVNVLQGLGRLETPLMVIACPLDPIAPVSNLQPFFDRLPSKDKRFVELSTASGCAMDYSHVDPPFARNAASEVFTPIAEWIKAHPTKRTQPRADAASVQAVAATVAPANIAPAPTASAELPRLSPVTIAQADAAKTTSWGKALESAASILSGLDEGPEAKQEKTGNGASHRRAPVKKFGAGKHAAKTSDAKAKASTKAKRAAAKPVGKPSKPSPVAESPNKGRGKRATESSIANSGGAVREKPAHRSTKAKATRKRSTKRRG